MKNFFSRASSGNKKSAGDSIIASQNLSGSTSNTSAAVASNPNSNAQNLQNQNLNHVNQSSSSHSMPNANPLTTPTDLNTNTGSITGVRRNSRPPAIVTENLESSNQDEIQQQVQVQPQHSTSNSIIDVDSGNLIISMNSNMSSTVGNLNQSLVNLQSSGTGTQNHNGIQQQNQNQNDLIVAQQQQSQVQVNRSAEAKILETNSPAHVRIGASPIMNIQNLNANLAAVGGLSMSALTQHRDSSSSLSPKDDEVCENQQHHVNHMNQIGRSQQTQSQNQNQSSNVQHGNQNPSTVISSQQNNLGNNLNLNQSYDQNHTINSQTQTVVGNTATQNYNSNSSSNTATITPVTQSRLRNLTGTLSDKATSFKSKFLGIGNSSLNVLQQIQSHNPTANLSNNNQSHLNNLNNNNNQNSSNRTSSQAHSGPTSPGNISMTKYKLQDKLITSTTVQKTQNLTENGSGSPASQKHEEDQHPTLLKTECDSDLIKDNITSASPRSTVQVTNQQSEFGPDSIGSVTSGVDNNDSSVAKTSMTTFNKFRFNKSKSRQEVLSIVLWPLMSFLDMVDAVNLSMCCKEFYQNRRIAHLSLQPNLLSRNEFERWLPNQRYCGVLSLCLTNILLDLKNFKDLRVLKITLEISRKLRRSVYPHISSDCLLPYLNLNNLTDLSLDSLTVVPNLSDAVSLRHLFLAFRKEGTVRFNCGSKKLISVQLASCNGGTNGHSSAMDFPQLPASDVLAVLENLEEPKKLEHLRLRRIRITENVSYDYHLVIDLNFDV